MKDKWGINQGGRGAFQGEKEMCKGYRLRLKTAWIRGPGWRSALWEQEKEQRVNKDWGIVTRAVSGVTPPDCKP